MINVHTLLHINGPLNLNLLNAYVPMRNTTCYRRHGTLFRRRFEFSLTLNSSNDLLSIGTSKTLSPGPCRPSSRTLFGEGHGSADKNA